jgi:hypothetical protein
LDGHHSVQRIFERSFRNYTCNTCHGPDGHRQQLGDEMAHQVQLSWNADPDASVGYNVYRGTAAGEETTLLTATPITTTTFTDSTPIVGDNFYVVKAVAAGGVLALPSNEVSAVILPAPVTGLVVVSAS